MEDNRVWWADGMLRGVRRIYYVPVASKTSPLHRPNYSDTRFAQGREHSLYGQKEDSLHYVYSDRIWQWDYTKAQQASGHAKSVHGPTQTPEWYETYLSYYLGIPVDLEHIIGGVNVSNGCEYYVFGYREREES
jgi:hypothetical protein